MTNCKFIHAQRHPWSSRIEILIAERIEDRLYVANLTFREVDQFQITDPTTSVEMTEAQVLMDQLWNCGIRPTEGTGSAGSLKATENHLKDVRTLLFKNMGIEEK